MYVFANLPNTFEEALLIRARLKIPTPPELINTLAQSSKNHSLKLFMDGFGMPIGYAAYHRISKDTLRAMMVNDGKHRYHHELNDGYLYYFVDIVMCLKQPKSVQRQWRQFIKSKKAFVTVRKNKIGLHLKKRGVFQITYQPINVNEQ